VRFHRRPILLGQPAENLRNTAALPRTSKAESTFDCCRPLHHSPLSAGSGLMRMAASDRASIQAKAAPTVARFPARSAHSCSPIRRAFCDEAAFLNTEAKQLALQQLRYVLLIQINTGELSMSRHNFVAVGLLTRRDLDVLGSGFRRAYPLKDNTDFSSLLSRLDDAVNMCGRRTAAR
jgi:hypothetical protein